MTRGTGETMTLTDDHAPQGLRALLSRLNRYSELDSDALDRLHGVPYALAEVSGGVQLVAEGERPQKAFLVEEGWAMRHRVLEDGRRQILNFMIAGDLFDLQSFVGEKSDHTVETITPVRLRVFNPADFVAMLASNTDLALAMWWTTLQEEGILREQIVRNGRRTASERIAHLLLELARRLQIAGQIDNYAFRFPLTQTVLADALGLSNVHVSRSLKRLRERGLLEVRGGWAIILDPVALAAFADFQPNYLHLDAAPSRLRLLRSLQCKSA